jgi:hypothetical protein
MGKFSATLVAAMVVLFVGGVVWTANATGAANNLNSLATTYSPVENIACRCGPYKCACGWRRPLARGGYWPGNRCFWRGNNRVCRN